MAAISGTDLALTTARVGAARVGSFRVGFIPCATTGPGSPWFGEYIWDELKPPTTQWTLLTEDCVCGQHPDAAFTMMGISNPPPVMSLSAGAAPNPASVGQDVTFTPILAGGLAPYTYQWMFEVDEIGRAHV